MVRGSRAMRQWYAERMAKPKSMPWRVPAGFAGAFAEFQTIPNVGKATAEDMVRLRVRGMEDLAGRDPMRMYRAIGKLDGERHDPCVIDVFMAAVEYAKTGACKQWWKYTPERKAMLAATDVRLKKEKGAPRRTRSKR